MPWLTTRNSLAVIALNPDPNNLPRLDPKDAFLLGDPSSSTGAYTNGSNAGPATTSSNNLGNVTWLRKTEYLSRESNQRNPISQEPCVTYSIPLTAHAFQLTLPFRKHVVPTAAVDVSRTAQLATIDASFKACNEDFDLDSLRHPNNPNLVAVESYPILPDSDIWSNQYDLFRFAERPGERPGDVCSLLAAFSVSNMVYRSLMNAWTVLSCAPCGQSTTPSWRTISLKMTSLP